MPISGLVVTLREEQPGRTTALGLLASDARIEVGEAQGNRIPIVTETRTAAEAENLARELALLEGVYGVDVVSIDTSLDLEESPPSIAEWRGLAEPAAESKETHGPA
jgi:hypothetical protein